MSTPVCLACDLSTGAAPLPGGRLHRTSHWVVEHSVGPLGVGTLIVKPLRHVLNLGLLTPEESEELGPLLRLVTAAVTEVVEPEQVYVCQWSHSGGVPGHVHFVVQPATRALMERFDAYGPALQMAMFRDGPTPDVLAVEAICARFRSVFARTDFDQH